MTQQEIHKRLAIVKYLYLQGCEALLNGSPISKATGVLSFHDAVESFFVLVSEIVGVKKIGNLNFMDYPEEIKKADSGKGNRELTHHLQLKKLNELRVNFKHMGILPNEDEVNNLRVSLEDFLNENTIKFCGIDFKKVSLADSIKDEEVKNLVKDSETLIEAGDYEQSLVNLGLAFYKIFHKSLNKTNTFFGKNHVFLSPNVDLFHAGLPFEIQHDVERIINSFYEPIAEILNISILGIDYKKYAKFKCLIPGFVTMANGDVHIRKEGNEFFTRFNIHKKNLEFCYFFLIDAILKIEQFDFGLISSWQKPDKVTVLDEDVAIIYRQKNDREFEPQGKINKDTIIEFGPVAIPTAAGEYRQVTIDSVVGWLKTPVKTRQIDNPELEKFLDK